MVRWLISVGLACGTACAGDDSAGDGEGTGASSGPAASTATSLQDSGDGVDESGGGSGGSGPGGEPCPELDPELVDISHFEPITADETWTADAPHEVGEVRIENGATVTIEACTIVSMGGSIIVGPADAGTLDVQGELGREVRFVPRQTGPWGQIIAGPYGSVRLVHATLEGGGVVPEGTIEFESAVVFADATPMTGTGADLHVEHVAINGSESSGVALGDSVRFTPESTDLTVTGARFPVIVDVQGWGTVPDGAYTGNLFDVIVVDTQFFAEVTSDTVVRRVDVPYAIRESSTMPPQVVVGSADGSRSATLTLEAGVRLAISPDGGVIVRAGSSLVAVGTPSAPIVFEGDDADGRWDAIFFAEAGPQTALDYVEIRRAGDGNASSSCNPAVSGAGAAVEIGSQPAAAFITNSTFSDIGGHAINRAWEGLPVDFLPTNTFTNVELCAQSFPFDADGQCPPDRPEC